MSNFHVFKNVFHMYEKVYLYKQFLEMELRGPKIYALYDRSCKTVLCVDCYTLIRPNNVLDKLFPQTIIRYYIKL